MLRQRRNHSYPQSTNGGEMMELIGKFRRGDTQFYVFRGEKSYDGRHTTHIHIMEEIAHITDKDYRIKIGEDS